MLILSACLSQPVVTVVQVVTATLSRTDSTHTRGSRSTLFVSCPKTVTLHRALSYVTPHLTTPGTCISSSSSTTVFLTFSHIHFSASLNAAQIYKPEWRFGRALHPSQVISPSSLLNTRITGFSPKTISLLHTKSYVSNPCSSTDRA